MVTRRSDARACDVDLDQRTKASSRPRAITALVKDYDPGDGVASNFCATCVWNSQQRIEPLSRWEIQRRLPKFSGRSPIASRLIAKRANRIRCWRRRFQNGRLQ